MSKLSKKEQQFVATVWGFYQGNARTHLPWRKTTDPYQILVSELMLQQTQVDRVIPKYEAFIKRWPTAQRLARASLADVITAWQGLGYNRRAKYLLETAQAVTQQHKGIFPSEVAKLQLLPGVGPYTANAIAAFAFNQPVVLIETNVRQVFIHHFFPKIAEVDDTQLLPLIAKTLPDKQSRQWYSALMDYGSHLKRTLGNINRKSRQYTKQSRFKGSDREVRGALLRMLAEEPRTMSALLQLDFDTEKILLQIERLQHEGLVEKKARKFGLPT